jgi:hypothetical protein
MYGTFKSVTWLGIISSVICIIPIIFYDLSEKKHADYIRVLKIRAIVENYKNNEISNEDIENLKEIIDFANENKDAFVFEEISKFDCINDIFQGKVR